MKRSPSPGAQQPPSQEKHRDRPSKRSRQALQEEQPLDPAMIDDMIDFLDASGGAMDFGAFSSEFPGVKKRPLERYFNFTALEGNRWEITLRELGAEDPGPGPGPPDASRTRLFGRIRWYNNSKGYGFIDSPDEPGDIYVPRTCVPRELHSAPNDCRGIEVYFDFFRTPDGKPRAENVELADGGGRRDDWNGPPPPPRGMSPPREGPVGRPLLGRIAKYDRAKGFGFIRTPHEKDDIFFLVNMLPPDMQDAARNGNVVDIEVECDVVLNDGKPRATRVYKTGGTRRGDRDRRSRSPRGGRGPAPSSRARGPDGDDGRVVCGLIRAFDATKGFGFVVPDDRSMGDDVFFLRSELPQELRDAQRREQVVDRRVEFEVKVLPDGKIRAQRMLLLPPPGEWGGRPGGPGGPCMGMPPMMPPPGMPMGPPALPPNHFPGVIKKFDRVKGFGFVASPAKQGDIFFLPSALPEEIRQSRDTLEGMEVVFEYAMFEGKPRASRIRPVGPGFGMPPMMPMWMGPGPPPMGPPMGPPMMGPPPHMGPPPMMGPPPGFMGGPGPMEGPPRSGVYVGQICSFDQVKGYGFVTPDPHQGLNEDVFYLRGEMPADLKEATREDLINQKVEFEVEKKPDGKLRAKRMILLQHPSFHNSKRGLPLVGTRSEEGKIAKYDRSKGYGFIQCAAINENVFFLRTELPKDMMDSSIEEIKDTPVSFQLGRNEEGKPRATQVEVLGEREGGASGSDGDLPADQVEEGEVMSGVVVRYDRAKGYGFFAVEDLSEDIFFLRGELPRDLKENDRKEVIENLRFDFRVKKMPDGKLRAERLALVEEPGNRPESAGEEAADRDDPDGEDVINAAEPEEEGDPPIALGAGCRPFGVIVDYDPGAGSGILHCEGYHEDVAFQRAALPENFRSKEASQVPILVGVQASIDLVEGGKPRATHVTPLLRWSPEERCWLLRRE